MADSIACGTKAETLARLAPVLTRSYVKRLASFTCEDWRQGRAHWIEEIQATLHGPRLIVRSSARREDSAQSSHAGEFLSVLDVPRQDPAALAAAVDLVIESYGDGAAGDQVLVQDQLTACRLSGVLFTRDIGNLSPYVVFNYDDSGASTQSVTSGRVARLQTYVRFRGCRLPYPSGDLEAAFAAVEELETLLGTDRLEVELAVDTEGRVCLFQARPLVTIAPVPLPEGIIQDFLEKTRKKIEKLARPRPFLYGRKSVFGVMPDWNPAEIIGVRPRMLSLSLYKELITDAIWAYQRDNYGYKNLRSFPLLISFLGAPYIDVRVCFNSFVPRGLRDVLAERLVDYYIDRLVRMPAAHDKVEFEIVFSCYTPTVREEMRVLKDAGFTGEETGEVIAELRVLTNRILHPATALYAADLRRIAELRERRETILSFGLSPVEVIYWLIEDCKRYGTLPFSGLARAGFIAVQILDSLVKVGVLTPTDRDRFLRSLHTVTRSMSEDFARLSRGESSLGEFLGDYGHLRPGTYDILSPRYDEAPERYFGNLPDSASAAPAASPFEPSAEQRRRLSDLLRAEGIEITPEGLFTFLKTAIEGREYSKYVFTRSLSDALVQIRHLGERVGLSIEEMSHVNLRTILALYASLDGLDLRDILLRDSEANRAAHELTKAVRLPALILTPDDVFHFHLMEAEPNFIGTGRAAGEVVEETRLGDAPIGGKVVLIASADPGYDWIFLGSPAALVTMYGGANSHMAIRAAEQGLPAVIGCGETKFHAWRTARRIDIDCGNRRVVILP